MHDDYKNAYLKAAFGDDHTADFPDTLYLALFLAGDVEVAGGSYAREAVSNDSTNFAAPASGQTYNLTAVTFAAATADWGTIVGFKWMDAVSAGKAVHVGTLVSPTAINDGDIANFDPATLLTACGEI